MQDLTAPDSTTCWPNSASLNPLRTEDMTLQIADIYPLTPMQEGMLFHTLYAPASGVYSQQLGFLLRGSLDPVALQGAWRLIISRHPSFRTGFSWENRSTPLQAVFDHAELPWRECDLRGMSAEDQRQQVAELLAADQEMPYDLRRPPLVRFTLARLDDNLHQFIWSMHHLIIDGWSVSIVLGELHDLYLALSSGQTPQLPEPAPFKSHVSWVRSQAVAPAESFWRARLAGFTTPTPILGDRGAALTPSQLTRYEWADVALAEDVTEKLKRFGQRRKITLNTILQGAWGLLLSRYCGEREVVYGVVSAGRSESVQGMERIVGPCVNTLPTRVAVDPEASLGSWLQSLQEAQVEARQFEFSALTDVTDWSEVPAGLPLFDSIVGTENFPMDLGQLTDLGDLRLDINVMYTKTSSPLSLIIMPGQPLRIRALYDGDRWDADAIQRSLGHYRALLSGFAANPDANLGYFSLLTEAEFTRIVVEMNRTEAPLPFTGGIHEAVERCAEAAPDALAVEAGECALTYADLEDHANRLAARLLDAQSGPGSTVAICLGRSAENVVACLAALKTGAAYLPIDPEYPPDRIRFMLDDANPAITLTSPEWRDRLPQDRPVIEVVLEARERSAEPVHAAVEPDDRAYVIYTSGSTGEPKAVPITHRSLANLVGWHQRTFAIDASDRATLVASPAFDASVWETWPYLTSGSSLHVCTDDVRLSPAALIRWLCSNRITVSFMPTPLAEMLINESWPSDASLRLLLTGGDRLRSTPPLSFPATLVNNYGPTESTVVTTSAVIMPTERATVPTIGRPIDNIQVYVVDSNLNPVPVGVVGELCVAGMGLTCGYLNRPETTAQRFVLNPFATGVMYRTGDLVRLSPNLDLEFVGRNDEQVKIHGYRIELGEIEATLSKHPAVRQAIVTSQPGAGGEHFLVAHVVPRPMGEVDTGDVTDHVAAWQALYDDTYGRPAQVSESTLNIVGWHSSYDGSPMSPAVMEEQVNATAARVLERHPRSVLEIGCGTGMLLFRIAPHCDEYHALDFSAEALDYVRGQPQFRELTQVSLHQGEADNLSVFKPASFDCVVINSVVQYFPNRSYLTDVLRQASALVRPDGFIMVGDVRNHGLLHQFHTSIALNSEAASISPEDLRASILRQAAQEKELLLAPAFFQCLHETCPEIAEVEIQLRRGAHDSEISRFRYDAILHFSRGAAAPTRVLNYSAQAVTAEQALRLAETTGEAVAVCGIPNRRVWADHQAWLALSHGSAPHTLEELRLVGNQTPEAAQEPEEWWRVVEGTTYRALIRPSSADPSHFDVLLAPSEHQPPRWPTPDKPANGFSANLSNNPQEGQWLRSLPSALRDFLRDRLPPHMVPPAIVLSDELPTTGNGKVDRNLLRGPLVLSRPTEPNFIPPRTALEEQLCGIWSRVLGVDAVSVTSDFFELGGHSLMVAHLVAQVRATCQVDLPLRQFFENTSVAKTARWIETVRNGGQVDMGMPDLRAEARLDPQIAASGSSEPPLTGPVLLTGATGFLGGFLLQELLRTPGVEVLALVRDAADPVQAMARLHRSLEKLGIPEDEWMGRVRPIVGDLSKPLLGLTGKVFEALANSVERIYHNGAVVNMVLPYHTLKPANVDGTREILRLSARAGGSIPVHYISSLATLYLMRPDHPQTEIPLSFDDLDQELLRSASGGYGVSKFVAEQLVSQSGQAGIPSIIYRVGSVTGHSQTGAANTGDFLHAMLRGALQLGCLPRDVRLDPVPVDFVTRAIAHLASTDPPSGSIFHITNPRPMEVDQFVAWAENRGFPIALVDRKTWLRRINEQAARDGHNLQSFSALLQMLVDYQGLHRFMQAKIRQPDMSNTSRGLAATDISCPPVTSDLLDTYLQHFLRTGFIADHSQAPRPRSSQPRGEQ